jgi:hypothetical protein
MVTRSQQDVKNLTKINKATKVTTAGAGRAPGSHSAVPSRNGAENPELFGRVTVVVAVAVHWSQSTTELKPPAECRNGLHRDLRHDLIHLRHRGDSKPVRCQGG